MPYLDTKPFLYDGSQFLPIRGVDNNADGISPLMIVQRVTSSLLSFDGNSFNRVRGNSLGDLIIQQREVIPVTATAAAGSAATATLPAGGAGKFTYLTYLQIIMYATAALTGGATPNLVTTTNLPNSPVFTFPSALAVGAVAEEKYEGALAIKGNAANTAITIVSPALANSIWRINACYFIA